MRRWGASQAWRWIATARCTSPILDNNMVFRVTADAILHVVTGSGPAGFAGDNGPATKALLNSPTGVAVDSAGNIFTADHMNDRISKVTTGGIISTAAGSGESGKRAEFSERSAGGQRTADATDHSER